MCLTYKQLQPFPMSAIHYFRTEDDNKMKHNNNEIQILHIFLLIATASKMCTLLLTADMRKIKKKLISGTIFIEI